MVLNACLKKQVLSFDLKVTGCSRVENGLFKSSSLQIRYWHITSRNDVKAQNYAYMIDLCQEHEQCLNPVHSDITFLVKTVVLVLKLSHRN